MEVQKFSLKAPGLLNEVSDFVNNFWQEAYHSEFNGGFLRVYEDYSFLNGNNIVVFIRLDSTEYTSGIIRIEIIAGGAADNILNITNWGSEERRVNKFRNRLIDFCEENNLELNEEN